MSESLLQLATAAHAGTSFVPEQRGRAHVAGIESHLARVRETLEKYAQTAGQKQQLEIEYDSYRAGYLNRYRGWLSAKSRVLSPMITGPSKFPTRRNEKRLSSERNRLDELVHFEQRALRAAIRRIRKIDAPPRATALEQKLAAAEKRQEMMKAANKIVKSKKLTDAQKVEQLTPLVGSAAIAAKLLEPDFCGRFGFADFELKNNNANIRRMREQLEDYKRRDERTTKEREINGVTVTENAEADRLQLHFPGKPSEAVRSDLKSRGFRWSPAAGAWQRQLTPAAVYAAEQILFRLATVDTK
jgi:hypothetical protein